MSHQPDHTPRVRRVVLPSGKTIEVVLFDDADAAPGHEHGAALHVCAYCASELVYPVDWEEAGPEHWEVTLRCPDCEHVVTGEYHQEEVEVFDEELDRGTEALVRDLRRMVKANMEEEIARFVSALAADAILPEDF